MSKVYDYDAIEKRVKELWVELEPKIVIEICREFKLDTSHESVTLDELHSVLGMHLGFCHIIWRIQKKVLRRDYGIIWKSQSELNPDIFLIKSIL